MMKDEMNRRSFIKSTLVMLGTGIASSIGLHQLTGCTPKDTHATPKDTKTTTADTHATPTLTVERSPSSTPRPLHEAMYYKSLSNDSIQCQMCFRQCTVPEGKLGFCHNKKNLDGKYYSLIYGFPCALQIDPIEKEPSYHMLPGATIFCTGTASCNQRCKFCHNWEMSQKTLWQTWNIEAPPEKVVEMALHEKCDAVSFTYNEPTVFYEQMYDTAKLAKQNGLRALFHTNGTMNPDPLFALLEHMDAVTVDLKAFSTEFYERVSSSKLWPVLRTLTNIRTTDRHLEIVNLVIPAWNDDPEIIQQMCAWIGNNLGEETPLHFIRFFPSYKFQRLPPTPIETLEMAAGIADQEGLKYVYIGNAPGHVRNSTFCPACGMKIIERVHFTVLSNDVIEGRCRNCDQVIPGIWWDI